MPKPKIKWRAGEQEQLAKEIRNFNNRRLRAIKKNPELVGVIPTIPVKTTIKNIETRVDYERIKRQLNWSRANNAFDITTVGGAKVTKWQLRRAKSNLKRVNLMREKERIKANVSTEKGTMGSIEANNLLPKKMPYIKNQTAWGKFERSLEKQVWENYFRNKSEIYSENYVTAWNNVFGEYRIDELLAILKDLSYMDIGDAMFEDARLDINFVYGKDAIDLYEKADAILDAWIDYINTNKYAS